MQQTLKKYLSKIKKIDTKTRLILVVAFVTTLVFYWQEVRPVIARSSCYEQAIKKARDIVKEQDSEPYLYDREHWRTYETYENHCGIFDIGCNNGPAQFTFEDNIKSGIEPSYIQENLDRISKQTNYNEEDYTWYYKVCLQSKGL